MRTGTWVIVTAVLLVVTAAVGWNVLRAEGPTEPDWVAEAEAEEAAEEAARTSTTTTQPPRPAGELDSAAVIPGTTAAPDPVAVARAEYVAAATAICQAVDDGNRAGVVDALRSSEDVLQFLQHVVDVLADQLRRLRELTPPPGDEAVVARFLDLHAELVGSAQAVIDRGGFVDYAERVSFETDNRARVDALTDAYTAYGIGVCA